MSKILVFIVFCSPFSSKKIEKFKWRPLVFERVTQKPGYPAYGITTQVLFLYPVSKILHSAPLPYLLTKSGQNCQYSLHVSLRLNIWKVGMHSLFWLVLNWFRWCLWINGHVPTTFDPKVARVNCWSWGIHLVLHDSKDLFTKLQRQNIPLSFFTQIRKPSCGILPTMTPTMASHVLL